LWDSEFSIRATLVLFIELNSNLFYGIRCKHFTQFGGLLRQGLYVGLTFMVINTVFARPYNSGLFFLLLAFWSVLELKESENKWKWTFLLSVGLVGAMLSHYFAFFVAVIIGTLALFYVGKRNIPKVIIAGGIAVLLFLPHIGITLYQINRGGLGWLAAPDLKWPVDFAHFFFNDSWMLMLIFGIAFWISILYFGMNKWTKKSTLSVSIFLAAFIGAYLVSHLFTPILRDLVMIFLLPFVLLPALSRIKVSSQKWMLILIGFVTLIPIVDSVFRYKLMEPVHFGVFKENGNEINRITELYGKENITFASNYNNINYINYYVKDDLKEEIVDWDEADALYLLADRAKASKTKYFCYSFSNKYHVPMFLEVIRKYYPVKVSSMTTKFTCVYLYSKEGKRQGEKTFYTKTSADTGFVNSEFIMETKIPFSSVHYRKSKDDYFVFTCTGILKDLVPLHLVVTVERNGATLMNGKDPLVYYGYDQSRINEIGKEQEFLTAFDLPEDLKPTDILKAYIWNPEKGMVKISSLQFRFIGKND